MSSGTSMATPCGWALLGWWLLTTLREVKGQNPTAGSPGMGSLPLRPWNRRWGLDGCWPCLWPEREAAWGALWEFCSWLEENTLTQFGLKVSISFLSWLWKSSNICILLYFIFLFKPLIHGALILVYGLRKWSSFIVWHGSVQFAQHHLLKRLALCYCIFLPSSS